MVVAVLFIAGDQVPLMLFVDVVGKFGMVVLIQNGPTCAKFGVISVATCMVMLAVVAHCPADGVNV